MWFIGSEATSIDLIADQYQSVMKTIAHICLSIGLLMAWGCTEESLDYRKQEGYVQIALSWDEGFSPAGSRFYFYPENGGEMLSFDCPSEGFGGVLPVGRYRVIVVNSDCVNVAVRNERSYDTAEIYVLPDEDGEHVCQPERLAYATRLVESETLEAVKDLRKKAEREKYLDRISGELDAIGEKLKDDKNTDLELFGDEIRKLIGDEIILRYHYETGVARHTALHDPEVRQAVEVLKDQNRYRQIVTSQDTPRK